MEQNRESGNRGGQPGGEVPGDRQRGMPAHGFEGMNYEQRREPYYTKRQPSRQNDHENPAGASENNRDDRSPI